MCTGCFKQNTWTLYGGEINQAILKEEDTQHEILRNSLKRVQAAQDTARAALDEKEKAYVARKTLPPAEWPQLISEIQVCYGGGMSWITLPKMKR